MNIIFDEKLSDKQDYERVYAYLYLVDHPEFKYKSPCMAYLLFDGDLAGTEAALKVLQEKNIAQKQEPCSQ